MRDSKNPYVILGVSNCATAEEIKTAFRRLAAEHHPDKNPEDPKAVQRMQRINWAWSELNSPEKRRATNARLYDEIYASMKNHTTPPPQPAPTTNVNWGAAAALGFFAIFGIAIAAAMSTKDTWDPTAGRYRGPDGRFTSG